MEITAAQAGELRRSIKIGLIKELHVSGKISDAQLKHLIAQYR